ncbi:uncharacterized protein LOC126668314 [Mercurialis annua]|uniref:uncharacterized protein LOC126668314 n=1 Tax=Mercurialis annua TaxID=3986 RepID=UPI00215DF99C|nr:uncharacterized protein LOC126668314 [Mercurialis annua]
MFLLQFEDDEGKMKALCDGPIFFDKRPLAMKEWHRRMRFEVDEMIKIPIWVQFHKLPWEFWTPSMLGKMASMCGRPMYTDQCTSDLTRLSYARVLVEMEIFGEFPAEIILEDERGVQFNQKVAYEWRPPACSRCKAMGHTISDCKLEQKIWVKKTNEIVNRDVIQDQVMNNSLVENKSGKEKSAEVIKSMQSPDDQLMKTALKGKEKVPNQSTVSHIINSNSSSQVKAQTGPKSGIIGDRRPKKVNVPPDRGK